MRYNETMKKINKEFVLSKVEGFTPLHPSDGNSRSNWGKKNHPVGDVTGFTLVEMLVVVAIIGILSAAVLVALGPARDKAKDARVISAVNQARSIVESQYNPSTGKYPLKADLDVNPSIVTAKQDASNNGATMYVESTGAQGKFRVFAKLNTKLENKDVSWCADSSGFSGQLDPGTTLTAGSGDLCK